MIRFLKFGCLFITSHALLISNFSNEDIHIKASHICHNVSLQKAVKIPPNQKGYIYLENHYPTLCVLTQITKDNEEHVQLIKILNSEEAQLMITIKDGKPSIEKAFC